MRVILSEHALLRMSQMSVTKAEVESAIAYPESRRPSTRHIGTRSYVARRITVAAREVEEDGETCLVVVTVLWTAPETCEFTPQRK